MYSSEGGSRVATDAFRVIWRKTAQTRAIITLTVSISHRFCQTAYVLKCFFFFFHSKTPLYIPHSYQRYYVHNLTTYLNSSARHTIYIYLQITRAFFPLFSLRISFAVFTNTRAAIMRTNTPRSIIYIHSVPIIKTFFGNNLPVCFVRKNTIAVTPSAPANKNSVGPPYKEGIFVRCPFFTIRLFFIAHVVDFFDAVTSARKRPILPVHARTIAKPTV